MDLHLGSEDLLSVRTLRDVLDAMLVPKIFVPARECIDALIALERLRCRVTIISFTGHEGYARAASQTQHFRDYVRAHGLQMGGGIFLTNAYHHPLWHLRLRGR